MESRNYFTYGSVLSSDYDVYVLDAKLNNSTKREYDTVSIAGRNGDLHIDKKRYSNMSVQYSCAVVSSAGSRINEFMAALLAEDLNSKLPSGDVNFSVDNNQNVNVWRYYLSMENQLKNNWSINYGAWYKQSLNHSMQKYISGAEGYSYIRQKEDIANIYIRINIL